MADISLDADKMAALKKRFQTFREEQKRQKPNAETKPQQRLNQLKASLQATRSRSRER